jgi:drug/metabolite transporter (DMT)-like permease
VLIMVRPGGGVFQWMALAALGGTLAYALAMLLVRRLSRSETNVAIVFYSGALATLASGAALPLVWQTPYWADLPWLAAIGLIGGVGHLVLTQAFRLAPASRVTPFEYSGMIWAVLFGWAFWQEAPDTAFYAGAALVIGAGLYILHREVRRGRTPADRLPGEALE